MRKLWICAALFGALGLENLAFANGPEQYAGDMGGGYCDPCCDPCSDGNGGHFGNHRRRRNQELGFNCGCNGSYKFPVPPLYTYHWPGMYQATLMTDYHSPWRFPPLKPYIEEVVGETQGASRSLRRVQPTANAGTRSVRTASFADQLDQTQR